MEKVNTTGGKQHDNEDKQDRHNAHEFQMTQTEEGPCRY